MQPRIVESQPSSETKWPATATSVQADRFNTAEDAKFQGLDLKSAVHWFSKLQLYLDFARIARIGKPKAVLTN